MTTKYIKPGMTDREAIAAIVTDIINRNKTTRRYDWLTVVKDTERTSYNGDVIDDCGNIITDEPPLGILQNANDGGVVISYPVKIHGKRGEMIRDLIDWSTLDVDAVVSAIIADGIADDDVPPEIVEFYNGDKDDPVDLEKLEKELVETVEFALDPSNNSVDYYDAKPDYDKRGGFWISGENIDGGDENLDGFFGFWGDALQHYANDEQALHVNVTGHLSDSIYYDRDGVCVNYASGDDALIDLFKVDGRCDVEIDFNTIDDDEIKKIKSYCRWGE